MNLDNFLDRVNEDSFLYSLINLHLHYGQYLQGKFVDPHSVLSLHGQTITCRFLNQNILQCGLVNNMNQNEGYILSRISEP